MKRSARGTASPVKRDRRGLTTALALLLAAAAAIAMATFVPVFAQQDRSVEVVWSTEGPSENPFRRVGGMVGAPDGSVYITDPMAHTIYRFDPHTGSYIWFDQQGQGPGELDKPFLVSLTPNGEVAVYDIGRRMVLRYSHDLEPLDQVVLGRALVNPKGFAFLNDGSFIITGSFPSTSVMGDDFFGVHRFSGADGKGIGAYVLLPKPSNPEHRVSLGYVAGGPVFGLEEGGFLYANSAPHQILHFDSNFDAHEIASEQTVVGPVLETFATEYMNEQRGRAALRFDWFHDQARGVFRLADGRVLHIITRRHSGTSTWELWSMQGALLERFQVDEAWHPFGITRDEDILVSYNDPDTGENVVAAIGWR